MLSLQKEIHQKPLSTKNPATKSFLGSPSGYQPTCDSLPLYFCMEAFQVFEDSKGQLLPFNPLKNQRMVLFLSSFPYDPSHLPEFNANQLKVVQNIVEATPEIIAKTFLTTFSSYSFEGQSIRWYQEAQIPYSDLSLVSISSFGKDETLNKFLLQIENSTIGAPFAKPVDENQFDFSQFMQKNWPLMTYVTLGVLFLGGIFIFIGKTGGFHSNCNVRKINRIKKRCLNHIKYAKTIIKNQEDKKLEYSKRDVELLDKEYDGACKEFEDLSQLNLSEDYRTNSDEHKATVKDILEKKLKYLKNQIDFIKTETLSPFNSRHNSELLRAPLLNNV